MHRYEPGSLMTHHECIRPAHQAPRVTSTHPTAMAHALHVLVPGRQARRDRGLRVPLLVAYQQARPMVRDLEAPRVPHATA